MFHEQTGYDFGNSRRSQEDARSPDAAVRVPAIAHLKKIAYNAVKNENKSVKRKTAKSRAKNNSNND